MAVQGNLIIKLRCGHSFDLGFVYDLEESTAHFEEQELICQVCSHKGLYSRQDLDVVPARIPLEE